MKRRRLPRFLFTLTLVLLMVLAQVASAATVHTVQPGEWLSSIAPKYGLTWQALYEANQDIVKNANLIFPGQQLRLPGQEPETPLGTAKAAFQPPDEIPGIPSVRIEDTALMDWINRIQLDASGADVSAAIVPDGFTIKAGNLYAADLSKMASSGETMLLTTLTGAELKKVMEWGVSGYHTWQPGDMTVGFHATNTLVVFAGVSYLVDIGRPAGSRVMDLKMNGNGVDDDAEISMVLPDSLRLALQADGLLMDMDAVSVGNLREHANLAVRSSGTLEPLSDNNWRLVGAQLQHPLRDDVIAMVKAGTLTLPAMGVLNIYSLMENGPLSSYNEILLMHINDTHGRIKAGDGMGFARIDTLAAQYRAVNTDTLLLDIGDTFHGVNFVTLTRGESAAEIMNLMKFAAMVPGNHDFNYGQERLLELDDLTDFPILAANVYNPDGSLYLQSHLIVEMGGVKVALIGLATPETVYKTNPLNVENLTFEDPIIATKKVLESLEGEADLFVALAHLGIEGDNTSRMLAEAVPELAVILDGHSHSLLNERVNGVLLAQASYYDRGVGMTRIILKNGVLDRTGTAFFGLDDTRQVVQSESILAAIKEADESVTAITSTVIGTSPVDLDGERANVRTKPTNLANLITEAMKEMTGADVALTNGGGIRASIARGDVTKGDVLTVLPFGNYVVVKELLGSDLLEALELGFSLYPEPLGAYSQTAGLLITFDSSQPAGSRIVEVMVNGVALDSDATYTVATNDFMAVGGDNYTMLANGPTIAEFPSLDEILIEYIQEYGFDAATEDDRVTDIVPEDTGAILIPAA